ncbi:MAG: ATP-binding protein [Kofleriaceae bacterium]|nr:ATP-binding protein [Kofleriaceae bacterium]
MISALGWVVAAAFALAIAWSRRGREAVGPRHALLAAVVDEAPSATVVLDDSGVVRYANQAAAQLFFGGALPADASLAELARRMPDNLRRALAGDRTELIVLGQGDDQVVLQVTKQTLALDGGHRYTVLAAHALTDELLREEVRAYKRLFRVLSHELNNSLAPVASLASTGRRLVRGTDAATELEPLFDTIAERVEHLRSFLGQYASLARLPRPRCRDVSLELVLGRVAKLFPGVVVSPASAPAWVDEGQLEQLLVNLVKNALEAGSDSRNVSIISEVGPDGRLGLTVADRGRGMSDEVLASAVVPFFSTKDGGSGLGLAICREIVEGHGGRLRLRNRTDGGGAEAVIRIPGKSGAINAPASWTFTRP